MDEWPDDTETIYECLSEHVRHGWLASIVLDVRSAEYYFGDSSVRKGKVGPGVHHLVLLSESKKNIITTGPVQYALSI